MKKLPFALQELQNIVTRFPTPFYIYDEKAIRENARKLVQAFAWNPGFREYYSVKTAPNPVLIELLKQEGCGADCASETELLLAEATGLSGEKIMFTSNNTSAEEYRQAHRLGAIINLDDTGHIDFLQKAAGIPDLICCRYNYGGELRFDGRTILNFTDNKTGATKEQILTAFRRLSQLGVKRFGLHAQFGGHQVSAAYFGEAIRPLFSLAVELYKTCGIKVDFINFAGGLGIAYKPTDSPTDITAVSAHIRRAYEETLAGAGLGSIPLYAELGLFMTGPYGYFVTSVRHIKQTGKQFVGLDASTNSFMSGLRYNDYHQISVPGKENEPADQTYDLTGALCEGGKDRFALNRPLPRLSIGDLIVFHDAGAYAYAHSHNFNGKLRPAELLLAADGSVKQIRRAETPADYFATLRFPGSKYEMPGAD